MLQSATSLVSIIYQISVLMVHSLSNSLHSYNFLESARNSMHICSYVKLKYCFASCSMLCFMNKDTFFTLPDIECTYIYMYMLEKSRVQASNELSYMNKHGSSK